MQGLKYHIASLMWYHCYEWVIFHIGCEVLFYTVAQLLFLYSRLHWRLGLGVSDEKFFKTYFQIYAIPRNFFVFWTEQKSTLWKNKFSLFFLIKNIGIQLVFFVKQRSLKFVKSGEQYSTYSVYNQPLWPRLSLVLCHIIRNTSSRNGRRWPAGHDYNFVGIYV